MQVFSTTGILLRRIDYGDYDRIITFISADMGKLSVIAKSARKSSRRFGGTLEPFCLSRLVCRNGRGKLPLLEESSLQQSFSATRSDIRKLSYASYWAELLSSWLEENHPQNELYRLFLFALENLEQDQMQTAVLHLLFQIKFMEISGFFPNLNECCQCGKSVALEKNTCIAFDLAAGGILCSNCKEMQTGPCVRLSKGSGRQLLWLGKEPLEKAGRLRLSEQSLKESQEFLEAFVPYHLGSTPRSLKFLRQMREEL
ncbi:MAG: DNA repair protein RecO [Desulfococcaceae bacterium]